MLSISESAFVIAGVAGLGKILATTLLLFGVEYGVEYGYNRLSKIKFEV